MVDRKFLEGILQYHCTLLVCLLGSKRDYEKKSIRSSLIVRKNVCMGYWLPSLIDRILSQNGTRLKKRDCYNRKFILINCTEY